MIHVTSVNLARARHLQIDGREVLSAIGKRAREGTVQVGPLGLAGDEQADPSVHGGLSKAIYAYPGEHYPFWQTVRAQARAADWNTSLAPGSMGENLTLSGLLEEQMWIGDLLRLPHCTLAISEPRMPCFKFTAVMGFSQAAKMMMQSGYCGTYLTVIETGALHAGDEIVLVPGERQVNVRELFLARRKR
jgi:MOSC domain-containing protein YiiM